METPLTVPGPPLKANSVAFAMEKRPQSLLLFCFYHNLWYSPIQCKRKEPSDLFISKKTCFLNSSLMPCLVEIYYCDNRISFRECSFLHYHSICDHQTASVGLHCCQIEFGTRNKTVHRRGTPPTRHVHGILDFTYVRNIILNDFYITHIGVLYECLILAVPRR